MTGFRLIPSAQRRGPSRVLGFILLFGLIGLAFWKFHEQSLERLQARQFVVDQTDTLSLSLKKDLVERIEAIRSRYGIKTRIVITETDPLFPDRKPDTMYIYVNPGSQASAFLLPPLLKRGLEEDFIHYLDAEHFAPYWAEEDGWVQGLFHALDLLLEKLRSMEEFND
ncbi:MAG: hypothetical protein ACOC0U_06740 [Desulfovibrionales bacterium]